MSYVIVIILPHYVYLNTKFTQVYDLSIAALVMVALWNRADHYIFILSFVLLILLLLLLLLLFPRLISAVAVWMSAILAHMVWRP